MTDPFDINAHPPCLINISTGMHATREVQDSLLSTVNEGENMSRKFVNSGFSVGSFEYPEIAKVVSDQEVVECLELFSTQEEADTRMILQALHYYYKKMSSLALNPIQIFSQGAEEEKAETARLSSFVGAIAIGDLVKSTLGPKGMDKILQSGEGIQVTNDGATILKSIGVDLPAAKVLVDISKVQDDEVGDGTTSVVVFACELLKEAEQLISQKIHPQTIISGWRLATDEARKALTEFARDHGKDEKKFKKDLMNIARTTLSSKILTQYKDHFSNLCVDAVLRLKGSGNLDAIQLIKILGGGLQDSYLDEGFLLEKKIGVGQPKRLENCKILVANTPMDSDKIKIFGSKVKGRCCF
ncbi:CCT2 [Mytilus coruscus]|uniref:CCT2 n=1 Tax=Mytilus coruscus TaxID=42192 RepID=A0A6J8C1Y4_MYTCO|nr:CCT2 [Mytilus coruscus]